VQGEVIGRIVLACPLGTSMGRAVDRFLFLQGFIDLCGITSDALKLGLFVSFRNRADK